MPRQSRPRWFPPRQCWRYRENNRTYYAPRSIGPNDEARAWQWVTSLTESTVGTSLTDDLTVIDMRELYLQHQEELLRQNRLTMSGYQNNEITTRHFCGLPGIADLPVTALTPEHAEKFRAWAIKEKYKPSYVGELLFGVVGMLNWACRPIFDNQRLLNANPWAGVKIARVRVKKQYTPAATTRRFLRLASALYRKAPAARLAANRDVFRLLRMARLTGCRPGELCGLRWSDFSEDFSRITLPPERHKNGRHTREPRVIYIPAQCDRLMRLLRGLPRRADGFVFGNARGRWRAKAIGSRMLSCHRRVNRPDLGYICLYDLRHTYCTDALAGGASYADVAKLVGNSPGTLAKYYDHPVAERLASVADEIAKRRQQSG